MRGQELNKGQKHDQHRPQQTLSLAKLTIGYLRNRPSPHPPPHTTNRAHDQPR